MLVASDQQLRGREQRRAEREGVESGRRDEGVGRRGGEREGGEGLATSRGEGSSARRGGGSERADESRRARTRGVERSTPG